MSERQRGYDSYRPSQSRRSLDYASIAATERPRGDKEEASKALQSKKETLQDRRFFAQLPETPTTVSDTSSKSINPTLLTLLSNYSDAISKATILHIARDTQKKEAEHRDHMLQAQSRHQVEFGTFSQEVALRKDRADLLFKQTDEKAAQAEVVRQEASVQLAKYLFGSAPTKSPPSLDSVADSQAFGERLEILRGHSRDDHASIKKLTVQINDIEKRLLAKDRDYAIISRQTSTLQSQTDKLMGQMKDPKSSSEDVQPLKDTIANALRTINIQSQKIQNLERGIDAVNRRAEAAERTNPGIQMSTQTLVESVEQITRMFHTLDDRHTVHRDKFRATDNNFRSIARDFLEQKNISKALQETVEANHKSHEDNKQASEGEIAALRMEIDRFNSRLQEHEREPSAIQDIQDVSSRIKDKIELDIEGHIENISHQFRNQLDAQGKIIEEIAGDLSAHVSKSGQDLALFRKKMGDISEQRNYSGDLTRMRTDIERLKTLESLTTSVDAIRNEIAQLQRRSEDSILHAVQTRVQRGPTDSVNGLQHPAGEASVQVFHDKLKTQEQQLDEHMNAFKALQLFVENLNQRFQNLTTTELAEIIIAHMSQLYPNHPANVIARLNQTTVGHQALENKLQTLRQELETKTQELDTKAQGDKSSSERKINEFQASLDKYGKQHRNILQVLATNKDVRDVAIKDINGKISGFQLLLSDLRGSQTTFNTKVSTLFEKVEGLATIRPVLDQAAERAQIDSAPPNSVRPANDGSESDSDRPLTTRKRTSFPVAPVMIGATQKRKHSDYSSEVDEEDGIPAKQKNRDKQIKRMNLSKGGGVLGRLA